MKIKFIILNDKIYRLKDLKKGKWSERAMSNHTNFGSDVMRYIKTMMDNMIVESKTIVSEVHT